MDLTQSAGEVRFVKREDHIQLRVLSLPDGEL